MASLEWVQDARSGDWLCKGHDFTIEAVPDFDDEFLAFYTDVEVAAGSLEECKAVVQGIVDEREAVRIEQKQWQEETEAGRPPVSLPDHGPSDLSTSDRLREVCVAAKVERIVTPIDTRENPANGRQGVLLPPGPSEDRKPGEDTAMAKIVRPGASRTAPASVLRGGIGDAPLPVVVAGKPVVRTAMDVQAIVDRLVRAHGPNLPDWPDCAERLAAEGLATPQVTPTMWRLAAERAERQPELPKPRIGKACRLEGLPDGTYFAVDHWIGQLVRNDGSAATVEVFDREDGKRQRVAWSPSTEVRVTAGDSVEAARKETRAELRARLDALKAAKQEEASEGRAAKAAGRLDDPSGYSKLCDTIRGKPETEQGEPERKEGDDVVTKAKGRPRKAARKVAAGGKGEVVQVPLDAARSLLAEMGVAGAAEFGGREAGKWLRGVREWAQGGEYKDPETDGGKALLAVVGKALAREERIKVVREEKAGVDGEGARKSPREGSISGFILDCLRKGPVAKDKIVEKVVKAFPDRKPDTLRNTVAWNISVGLPRAGVAVVKDGDGLFSVVA